MGKLSSNILGPISGRVGNVVGSSWKGIPYLKSAYGPRTTKITDKEKANRQKFKVSQEWLGYLVDFVRVGFKGYTSTVEGFVAAKSYLMKNAMELVEGRWQVNPALMKVSYGTLPLSKNIAVKATDRDLQFTWDATPFKDAHNKDQVMLLAYDIKKQQAFQTTTGAFRNTGSDILPSFRSIGDSCHVWVAFVADDRSRQSDSIYLGEIVF